MAKNIFVLGSYQSPDILLTDPFSRQLVPLASPNGESQLVAYRNYHVQARVHNTLAAESGVLVDFYEAPGGFGSILFSLSANNGGLVPAHSTALFPAQPGSPSFQAPPLHEHKCVVVSVRCNIGGEDCTSPLVSDPGLDRIPQCSAWRNTESVSLNGIRQPFPFNVNLTAFGSSPHTPTLLRASASFAPRKWFDTEDVCRAVEIMEQSGSVGHPPFLLKSLASTLQPVDLSFQYKTSCHAVNIKPAKKEVWHLHTEYGANPDVVLTCQIPASEPGDAYLLRAHATYPAKKLTVEFLQVIWITE